MDIDADRLKRKRSVPGDTVGRRIGNTLYPLSNNLCDRLTVLTGSPIINGCIWLTTAPELPYDDNIPLRAWESFFSCILALSIPSTRPNTLRVHATVTGGNAVENIRLRA